MHRRGELVAWAAGLFEGEGCFHITRKRTTRAELTYAHATVTSTDRDVLERLQEIVGFGSIVSERARQPQHKQGWRWYVSSRDDFLRLATLLGPWLGERRRARLAEVLAATSAVRRSRPPIQKCKRGHPLTGANRKPNGRGANGKPKIACRECVNARA